MTLAWHKLRVGEPWSFLAPSPCKKEIESSTVKFLQLYFLITRRTFKRSGVQFNHHHDWSPFWISRSSYDVGGRKVSVKALCSPAGGTGPGEQHPIRWHTAEYKNKVGAIQMSLSSFCRGVWESSVREGIFESSLETEKQAERRVKG